MKLNIEHIKTTCQQDLDRRLETLIPELEKIVMEDESGLFMRILNTSRGLLFSTMGDILNVSDSSEVQNRDELSFLESLAHLFRYYLYDDGELSIRWKKFDSHNGRFLCCEKEDWGAFPILGYATDEDDLAYEKEIHWLLNWHITENKNFTKKLERHFGKKEKDNKERFINYNLK